jgi:hypothetical protein
MLGIFPTSEKKHICLEIPKGKALEHLEQYLNEDKEREKPPDQVDLRDNGVEIDLPKLMR